MGQLMFQEIAPEGLEGRLPEQDIPCHIGSHAGILTLCQVLSADPQDHIMPVFGDLATQIVQELEKVPACVVGPPEIVAAHLEADVEFFPETIGDATDQAGQDRTCVMAVPELLVHHHLDRDNPIRDLPGRSRDHGHPKKHHKEERRQKVPMPTRSKEDR